MGKLFLNSMGLNTKDGAEQIRHAFEIHGMTDLEEKKIFIVSYDQYGLNDWIIKNCIEVLGFQQQNIFLSRDGIPQEKMDYVYVTEGNVFQILNYMRENQFIDYIQKLVLGETKAHYIGSSAGAMLAGKDIYFGLDFDKNEVGIEDFLALNLFDGTIIPHYEPENLWMYKSNTEPEILKKYKYIYSVNNEEVFVIDL